MYDFSKTRIHCSAISNIMASKRVKTPMQLFREAVAEMEKKNQMFEKLKKKDGPRGEKLLEDIEELFILIPKLEAIKDAEEPLSDGCKTFLTGVYASEKYGKWSISKDIGSRETQKGKEVEEEAITLVCRLDKILIEKNNIRIENNWFSGHPDCIEGENIYSAEKIHDVKSPWDAETFFANLSKPLSMNYYWQMQGYMDLTDAPVAEVHFCLINTPERFVMDAAKAAMRSQNFLSDESPEYKEAEKEIINNMNFDSIPHTERRIKFIVERNDDDIILARKRVEKCREWLTELQNLHLNFDFTATTRKFDVNHTYEPERTTSE